MGEEIREPRRVTPRSLFVAGFILAVGCIAGTLSLLVALSAEGISGLSGLPCGTRTLVALACIGFLSIARTIVLSLFPVEEDAHPALTLFTVLIMTLVLLTAGVAIYRSSRRAHQPDIATR